MYHSGGGGVVDNGGGYAGVGAGGTWEISVPFSTFVVNLKLKKECFTEKK